jgi:heme/copper-type cytochrome/quinol oxidase subunit 3
MRRGRGSRARTLAGIGIAILLGAGFVAVQALEWRDKPFSFGSSLYASFYFTITGVHIAHVLVGLAVLAALFGWTAAGAFSHRRHAALTIGALYWHFVDAVWLAIFTALYLAPRWGGG